MESKKKDLIEEIESYGVDDERVLFAMKSVPREKFVPEPLKSLAYDDICLPIGEGQTISQPVVVATMASAADIRETDVVLEIGAGCGYNAAILSKLAHKVFTTEIIPELVKLATKNIELVGCTNVVVVNSNGSVGYPEYAPYDVIMVTASAPAVPPELLDQLVDGGRLIIPVNHALLGYDKLTKVTRISESEFHHENLGDVAFVPLTGKAGFQEVNSKR